MKADREARRVAVVGAGPAGSTAAFHLARRGHHVTLIDKSTFPRDKTCGDWITRGALGEVGRMGLSGAALQARVDAVAVIGAGVIVAPNGRALSSENEEPSLCIPRRVFDALLHSLAVQAGCRPQTRGVRDLTAESRGSLSAYDAIVDARGVYAGVANTIALRRYETAMHTPALESARRSTYLCTDAIHRLGYGWVFPVSHDGQRTTYNVGVGVWKTAASHGDGEDIRDYFHRFTQAGPLAQALLGASVDVGPPRGFHLALADGPRPVVSGRIFRVGDAANLTDPVTGEGIANAMRSGRRVAEILSSAGSVEGAAEAWQEAYQREFLGELEAAFQMRALLAGTRRKNTALWMLRQSPAMARRFQASLEGVGSYAEVLPAWAQPLVRRVGGQRPWQR